MEIIILVLVVLLPFAGYFLYQRIRKNVSTRTKVTEFTLIAAFVVSLVVFAGCLSIYNADYTEAIDNVDRGYTPFSQKHILTPVVFFILAIASVLLLWLKGRAVPPLLFVSALVFSVIGMVISVAVLIQVSGGREQNPYFAILPVTYLLIVNVIFVKIALEDATLASRRVYRSKTLRFLNGIMAAGYLQPVWVIVLLVPFFMLVIALLTITGQDTHAITKVFTDTTTWHFSRQSHPPFLDHRGHYLCTVAACGDPDVVKPIRLGRRHGHEIIVNRQLQIANAFEELLQEYMPATHEIIRHWYDKYGYPLSRKIASPAQSNRVYRLMKPLEYCFLIVLYSCSIHPEKRIARQYAA